MRADRYREETRKRSHTGLKVLLFLIAVLLIAVLATGYVSYRKALASLSISFTNDAPVVEFGGEYPALDFVSDSVGDVSPSADLLSADELGEKTVVYTVSRSLFGGILEPSRDFTLKYEVVDTVAPTVLWSGSGAIVEVGSDFDVHDRISYGDNADPAPVLDIKGKVDTSKSGDHTLHATVTDSSGNATGWDIEVEVVDELPEPEYADDSELTKFKDFVSAYKGTGKSFGIDVSTWQGDVDYEAVKKAGCDFVIIRIGFSSDGEFTYDNTFTQNYERAKAAGLKVGLYLYSYDTTPESVRASAKAVIDSLDGDTLELPIAFDWENFADFQSYGISFWQLNRLYDEFADELSASGYECMLYGSSYYLESVWDKTDVRPVWLAQYADKPDYTGSYMIWQASCTGTIKGIEGAVDFNIMY